MCPIMSAHRHRSAGFGLLEALLLTFVLGGVLVNGAFWLKAQTESRRVETQSRLLRAAQQQVDAYIARFDHLPCPATTTSDGVANCSGGNVKGLLPWRDMGIDPSGELAGATRLGYLVYHSTAVDLTTVSDSFEPKNWDGSPQTLNHINLLDFCQNLTAAGNDTSTNGARVYNGATARPVAYAIAHPGAMDADGDGSLFDGRNASSTAEMEAQGSSSNSGNYDDQVIIRSFDELSAMSSCPQLISSLNGMALANNVANEVDDQKLFTYLSAVVASTISAIKAAVSTVKAVLAVKNLITAVATLSTAAAALVSAIAGCVFLVGCAEIPHAVAAVAAGVAAVAAGTVAAAANAASAIALVVATGLNASVAIKAGYMTGHQNVDLTAATSQAYTAWQNANTEVATRLTERNNAINDRNNACAASDNSWSDVINTAHQIVTYVNNQGVPKGTLPADSLDSYLIDVRSKQEALYNAKRNVDKAQNEYDLAVKLPQNSGSGTLSGSSGMISDLQTRLDAEKAKPVAQQDQALITSLQNTINNLTSQTSGSTTTQQISQLQAQINDLQTRINNETDPDRKAQMQSNLASLQEQLANLDTGPAGKLAALNAAKTQRDAAQTAYNTSRDLAVSKFYLWYSITTTTTVKDANGNDVTVTTTNWYAYDGRYWIAITLDDNANFFYSNPFGLAYRTCLARRDRYDMAQTAYNQAVTGASDAKKSYDSLKDIVTNPSIAPSLELKVRAGAGVILDNMDTKGGVQ